MTTNTETPDYTTVRIFGEDAERIRRIAEKLEQQTRGSFHRHQVISLALDAYENQLGLKKAA